MEDNHLHVVLLCKDYLQLLCFWVSEVEGQTVLGEYSRTGDNGDICHHPSWREKTYRIPTPARSLLPLLLLSFTNAASVSSFPNEIHTAAEK